MKDPVRGTARVVSATGAVGGATYENYFMTCVVTAPGIRPTSVERRGMAKVAKWPAPGDDLPVQVDRADPTRLRILWNEVTTRRARAVAAAQALASVMRAGRSPLEDPLRGSSRTTVVVNGRSMDLDAVPELRAGLSAIVAGATEDPVALREAISKLVEKGDVSGAARSAGSANEIAERLRRLESLHADGVISDEEYAGRRRQLIGSL